MPKLPAKEAKAVNDTESQSFTPVPPGLYPAILEEVNTGQGDKGPYWSWQYTIPEGFDHAGRKFWNITSLSEASRFKMKETFDAFGVPATTDTDELIGTAVTLRIGIRTIQKGERAGEQANSVTEVLPYNEGDFEPAEKPEGEEEEPF